MVGEDRLAELHKAHTLLLKALNPPESDKSQDTKSFYKTLRRRRKQLTPLSEEEEARWFSFDSFCELLGLAGLNQEDSGGLYAIHAHMNHNCEPNIRVSRFVTLPPTSRPPIHRTSYLLVLPSRSATTFLVPQKKGD